MEQKSKRLSDFDTFYIPFTDLCALTPSGFFRQKVFCGTEKEILCKHTTLRTLLRF